MPAVPSMPAPPQGVNAVDAAGCAGGADARAAAATAQEQPHVPRGHAGARCESTAVPGCNRGTYICVVHFGGYSPLAFREQGRIMLCCHWCSGDRPAFLLRFPAGIYGVDTTKVEGLMVQNGLGVDQSSSQRHALVRSKLVMRVIACPALCNGNPARTTPHLLLVVFLVPRMLCYRCRCCSLSSAA